MLETIIDSDGRLSPSPVPILQSRDLNQCPLCSYPATPPDNDAACMSHRLLKSVGGIFEMLIIPAGSFARWIFLLAFRSFSGVTSTLNISTWRGLLRKMLISSLAKVLSKANDQSGSAKVTASTTRPTRVLRRRSLRLSGTLNLLLS